MSRTTLATILLLGLITCGGFAEPCAAETPRANRLSERNVEAPFCYLRGGQRQWPILAQSLAPDERLTVAAHPDDQVGSEGEFSAAGLDAAITPEGMLSIRAADEADRTMAVDLVVVRESVELERQTITVRPAPPPRRVSYIADLVDDLIRIYWDESNQQFRPITRDGWDQYFRRLQGQGISRLIVWQSPFPLIADRGNYLAEDWQRYASQANAIIHSAELHDAMRQTAGQKSYDWLSLLMRLRLSDEFARAFTSSASLHGIALTASYRPFEPALMKYYQVPAFDANGAFLWNFLPLASPAVNYHPAEVGFVHYREILRQAGHEQRAALRRLHLVGIADARQIARRASAGHQDLQLVASPFPPLDESSYVLVRQRDGQFKLEPYANIRTLAESHRTTLAGLQIRAAGEDELIVDGLPLLDTYPYLILQSSSEWGGSLAVGVDPRVMLCSAAGNELGRVNVFCSLLGSEPAVRQTCIAGIPDDGNYRTEFQAIENGIDYFRQRNATTWPLSTGALVIHLGTDATEEMLDFELPAARQYALRELQTILQYPAFDEVFLNSRSHTQLAASGADGADGLQTVAYYRRASQNYFHYGIDRAYAPRSLADQPAIQELCASQESVERMTTWQRGEWQGTCQSPDCEFTWRRERNRAVARGVRALLADIEATFPDIRIRAVIPPRGAVENEVQQMLAEMPRPEGGTYGADYYRNIWSSLNHIPAIGEGMALVDLTGLNVEPVFLGIRYLPDQQPLEAFVRGSIRDLAENRGSRYRGPRSFFYEAQETLRAADPQAAGQRREQIMQYLLSLEDDINEVLLYEAADWAYTDASSTFP